MSNRSSIVLFDGTCAFCQGSVGFVGQRDPMGHLRFGAAQSPEGRALLAQYGMTEQASRTIVLIEDGRVFLRSTAALRMTRWMRWPWPLAAGLLIVPRVLRDAVYNVFSDIRYQFGRTDMCAVLPPEIRKRIITS